MNVENTRNKCILVFLEVKRLKKLAELRHKTGLTQEELADITGLSPSTIAMYEVGKRTPHLDKAKILADFFNVSIEELSNEGTIEKNRRLIMGILEEIYEKVESLEEKIDRMETKEPERKGGV